MLMIPVCNYLPNISPLFLEIGMTFAWRQSVVNFPETCVRDVLLYCVVTLFLLSVGLEDFVIEFQLGYF